MYNHETYQYFVFVAGVDARIAFVDKEITHRSRAFRVHSYALLHLSSIKNCNITATGMKRLAISSPQASVQAGNSLLTP